MLEVTFPKKIKKCLTKRLAETIMEKRGKEFIY
jgi:hypothetical protein